jgi:hypothetical protein
MPYLLPQIHWLNGVITLRNLCELIASTDSIAIHAVAVASKADYGRRHSSVKTELPWTTEQVKFSLGIF